MKLGASLQNLIRTPALRLRHLALVAGAVVLAGSAGVLAVTASAAPSAFADSAPYTAACTSSLLGSFDASGIITTGSLSANPVPPGGSETLNNYGLELQFPASAVNVAIANGVTSLTGTITTAIDATNITPSSTPETLIASTGPLISDTPLAVVTTPLAVSPSFTDASATGVVHLTQDADITVSFQAQVSGINFPIAVSVTCTTTAADIDTATIVSPIAPQITSIASDTVAGGSAFSYAVTAAGTPTPVLSVSSGSTLPAGVTFTDNGNGTATLAGPASVAPGVYTFSLQADNGVTPNATQAFTLTVAAPGSAAITSSPGTTVTAGTAMAPFTVTTAGFPVPSLTKRGALPSGVTFSDNHNGTATISGNPGATRGGAYVVTITASNDQGTASQTFTLVVNEEPAITSRASTTFTPGDSGTFTITTDGFPAPSLTESGTLPSGVTFTDNQDGTATISGVPKANQGGSYVVTITASNDQGTVTQTFILVVNEAPAITSRASATFTAGDSGTFTVTTNGSPAPSLTESGALPSGVTFTDNGNGTATISGIPATVGSYRIVITATNGSGSASESFTLKVSEEPGVTRAGGTPHPARVRPTAGSRLSRDRGMLTLLRACAASLDQAAVHADDA